ncbi:MAG: hypothetical protein LBH22_02615 [Bacteroidales bacterium]|jgi:uncharacterized membrane protein YGL010W|nr:hypothetical protein [Bacteroidales bacterium]
MKRKKIILWSVFVFSAICLTAVGIDAMLEKNLKVVAFCWIMISIGFVATKYLLNKKKILNQAKVDK